MRRDAVSIGLWLVALPVALALACGLAGRIRNGIELDRLGLPSNGAQPSPVNRPGQPTQDPP